MIYDIRSATPADIPGIARIHIDSWNSTYRGLIPQAYLDDLTLEGRELLWKASLPQPGRFTWVAQDVQDGIVAFAHAGPARGKDPGYDGELYALYAFDRHHRRGLGRRLLLIAAAALGAAGNHAMITWVLDGNPAGGFYAAMGGRRLGSKKFMMGGLFLTEHAYGWPDLKALLRPAPENRTAKQPG